MKFTRMLSGWAQVLAMTLAIATPALANVSLKNGNFFVGYTDLLYPGGFEPKVERVYNSKTAFNGAFGWGWGNEFDSYLTVSADGSVVVHEYGGGANHRFSPASFNAQELQKAVDMIADAARKAGAIGTNDQLASYKQKLKSDAVFRNDEWEKLRSRGLLKERQLANNTQLYSNRFSYQYITRMADRYVRVSDGGKTEEFSLAGRLIKVGNKNKDFVQFSYTKDGKLEKILDNFNRKIFFSYNKLGKIEHVQGESGKESTYRYNDMGELVYSKDAEGNVYTYKYSSDKLHNLVEIGYSDKTNMAMSYYGRDKFQNIKSVKDRDGTLSEYSYNWDKKDRGIVAVSVNVKGNDGKNISQSAYEYTIKNKADGEEWTYRMVATVDGERTETTYNECCGLPLTIKRGNEETTFKYDDKGRVVEKTTPSEMTTLAYDKGAGKVSKVAYYSKSTRKMTNWSEFKYDNKGNLIFARNSEKKGVQLFYDNVGRIKSLLDQDKRRIDFKYNEQSKPVEITDPKLGSITVTYTNSGEIKKVDSKEGRKIAMQVTSAFQNLLDIIRPAGVSLSF